MRLLHVIPEDGLGGAEIAARRAAAAAPDAITVVSLTDGPPGQLPDNVIYLRAPRRLDLGAAWKAAGMAREADIAVFSLWKSMLALFATKLRAPRTKIVLFTHSDRRVHALDHLFTAIGRSLADAVWADSDRSLRGLGPIAVAKGRVISFVLNRPQALVRSAARPHFIYWGRLNALKRLDRVIGLFARLAGRPGARLTLVGPDSGSEAALRAQVAELGLQDRVAFTGPKTFDEIADLAADHDIFLQLSDQEGAAMSLVEAMQLGLGPVVTPVGEMPVYVRHMESGLIYSDEDQAAADIARLLGDPSLFASVCASAVDRWAGARLYQEDVLAAAQELKDKA